MTGANGRWLNPVPTQVDHGTALALQSLSSHLGGRQDDTLRSPIIRSNGVAETRGNADVVSTYHLLAGWCEWWGHYNVGTTTAWSVAGTLSMVPPVAVDTTTFQYKTASMPGSTVRAYNGTFHHGYVEYTGAFTITLWDAAVANTQWGLGPATPFAWGVGSILSWHLRYPVQL